MSKHVAPGTATQVAHPARTVIRTVATQVGAILAFLVVAIPVIQDTLGPLLPPDWKLWLVSALAIVGAVQALFTRLMAIARAQGLLARVGLGTGVEAERIQPRADDLVGEVAE